MQDPHRGSPEIGWQGSLPDLESSRYVIHRYASIASTTRLYRGSAVLNKDMEAKANDEVRVLLPMSFADADEGVPWLELFEGFQ